MPDWVQYVRRHLALPGLNAEREAEIVEDLARQLEDAYRDALARGASEQQAAAHAREQIPDWESFAAELRQAERRHRQSHMDKWYDRADQAAARKGGHWTMFADLRRDLLYGLRMLAKNPGFTAVVLLTLALGIGGNTAVFSVVNNVILRPLPFENEEQLVRIRNYNLVPGGGRSLFNVNGRQFAIIREQNQVFSAVVALQSNSGVILGGDEPERISLIGVSNGWSSTLGVEPVWGRLFSPEEQRLGMESGVALINYGIWQNRFGGDANVLGKSLRVDDRSYLIIGVFPQGFNFPYVGDVWVPAKDEEISSAAIFSRMKPGVGLDQARAEMDALAPRIQEQYPELGAGYGIDLTPARESLIENEDRIVLALLGVVGAFLFIACVNVANLLLARSVTRQKEIAVRAALGATRGRQVRQLLTESMLISLLGSALGLLLALWLGEYLAVLVPSNFIEELNIGDVALNLNVLLFALGAALATGVIVGIVPALKATKVDLHSALKEGGRTTVADGKSRRLLSVLVVSEIALSLAMLTATGLMVRHCQRLQRQPLGFQKESLLTMRVELPASRYSRTDHRTNFVRAVTSNMQDVPGVTGAAVISLNPIAGGTWSARIAIEGRESIDATESTISVNHRLVTPGLFQSMGVPLIRGRDFTPQDREGAQPVVIISQQMARKFWPNENSLGKRVRIARPGRPWMTVVGVVGDVKDAGEVKETWYLPYAQHAASRAAQTLHLMVRSRTDIGSVVRPVQTAIWKSDKELAIDQVSSMEAVYSRTISQDRVGTVVVTLFATFGLLLAGLGIYGVTSFGVNQRTHEIGVRMAFGAQRRDVLKLVVGQGVVLILVGILLGLAGAYALGRVMASLVQGLNPADLWVFLLAAAVLTPVALLACYIPARRATKVDPMVALRYE